MEGPFSAMIKMLEIVDSRILHRFRTSYDEVWVRIRRRGKRKRERRKGVGI